MPKFQFRLDRVLGFRQLQEKWAREAYLAARAERLEAEDEAHQIETRKLGLLGDSALSLSSRMALEMALNRLDDDFRAQREVVGVLESEEDRLHDLWVASKSELESIEKLRVKKKEEWSVEEGRRLQTELDEWAVTRRPLA
jgi:flagellar export protein FliJ